MRIDNKILIEMVMASAEKFSATSLIYDKFLKKNKILGIIRIFGFSGYVVDFLQQSRIAYINRCKNLLILKLEYSEKIKEDEKNEN